MALDPYSLCPGGREKKIQFCCSDMIKEIEQIEQMFETKQYNACLELIESLEKNHPDRACLTVAKLSVYRAENKWQEALQLAKVFYEKEPENPIAASEYALALAMNGNNFRLAISVLIDGFEHSPQGITHSSLINSALRIGSCLLLQGLAVPAIAISHQLKRFPTVQNLANELLFRASSMVELPILLRDMVFDYSCPDQFPKKQEFMDAMELIDQMRWKKALAQLESLTQYDTAWPAIWRNIAVVRFWLLDNIQGCDALKKFTALPNTPPEDAVDAEAIRIFMTENILGDQIQVLYFEYEINDANTVYEKLASNPIFFPITLDRSEKGTIKDVPPQNGFLLLDRPVSPPETPITLDNVSTQLAIILVFGKGTNQPARMIVTELCSSDRLKVEHLLKETLGDWVTKLSFTQVIHTVSKSKMMIQPRFVLSVESAADSKKLARDYFEHIFINRWCKLPFGLLDGKTPNEAALDPVYRIRLLGIIQVIEFWLEENDADEINDLLRKKLNLPTDKTIVIPPGSDEEMMATLENYPVWRWHRFEVEKLPTAFLIEGFKIVTTMQEHRAAQKFAQELLNRPINTIPFPVRELAFEILILIAQNINQYDTALEWIEKAKKEAALNNSPDAVFFLHEIPIRLVQGQIQKFQDIVNYLVTNYSQDEKIMTLLRNVFVQFGIMNSDGTPNNSIIQNVLQTTQTNLSPEINKIWTPESVTKDNNRTKLWIPE
ncbi:MAG: hypothetical protein LBE12_12385 [Planctomycetaceae bacterium]|jgi:tetratricopeptide (TPR) repeat protein|nr:hypothetical protein [Planctomycetaceae bacterium]